MFNRITKTIPTTDANTAIEMFDVFKNNSGSFTGVLYPMHDYTYDANGKIKTITETEGAYTYEIYSYTTRMAAFTIINGLIMLDFYNDTKYSRTTSKHQSVIRRAIANMDITYLPTAWVAKVLTNEGVA